MALLQLLIPSVAHSLPEVPSGQLPMTAAVVLCEETTACYVAAPISAVGDSDPCEDCVRCEDSDRRVVRSLCPTIY